MATYVGQCFSASTAGSGGSLAATYSANVTNGHTIVLCVINNGTTSVTAVSDNAGNTYSQVDAGSATPARPVSMWYCQNVSGVTTSKTLTITFGAAGFDGVAYADDINTGNGSLDVHANASNGTSTSPSVGPTASVAQANEWFYAVFGGTNSALGGSAPTFTAGGSYAAAGSNNLNEGGFNVYVFGEFLSSSSASGGQSASGSLNSAPASSGSVVATFLDPSDPFPVGYQQEFPGGRAGHGTLARL